MVKWFHFGTHFNSIAEKARDLTKKIVSHSDSTFPEANTRRSKFVKEPDAVPTSVTFSNANFSFTFWLYGLLAVLLGFIVYHGFPVIVLILAAYIISIAIEWPVRFIKKLGTWRSFALFLCYFLVVVIILTIVMVIPFVAIQLGNFVSVFVDHVATVQKTVLSIGWINYVQQTEFLPPYFKNILLTGLQDPTFSVQLQSAMSQLVGTWQSFISYLTSFALKTLSSFLTISSKVSILLVLAVFFSIEKDRVLAFWVSFLSKQKTNVSHVHERIVTVYSKLQLWLKGQLFLMIYVGMLVFIGLYVLELFGISIDQKRLLAIMAGVTEIIPYLWPILWWIPAILVATLSHGLVGWLSVFIIFFIVQRTENNIVVPVVMNKVLWVNALVVFISMLLGAWLLGFIWVILAVPIAVIVTVLWDKTYK